MSPGVIQRRWQSTISSASRFAGARSAGPAYAMSPSRAGDETVVDDSEAIAAGRHRREAGITPDAVTAHAGNI